MKNIENQEKYILLDNLFNLFFDMKYQKEDDEHFNEEKIDLEQIVQKNIMLFRQLRTHTKAELNQAKHDRVLTFLSKLKTGIESNVEEYIKIADDIFSKPKFAELQPMFRNLNQVSELDKKSILMDSKLLDLLGEIEEEYSKVSANE